MSVSPDEGMMLVTQRMAADRHHRDGAPAGDGDGSGGLVAAADVSFILALTSAVKDNTRALRDHGARPRIPWEACHPIPLNPIAFVASGSDERWEPREGVAWHIVRVMVQSAGATGATSATMFRDSSAMPTAANVFTMTAGNFSAPYEPRGLILLPGQRLVFTSSGGAGGAVASGDAIEIALPWLPAYLI